MYNSNELRKILIPRLKNAMMKRVEVPQKFIFMKQHSLKYSSRLLWVQGVFNILLTFPLPCSFPLTYTHIHTHTHIGGHLRPERPERGPLNKTPSKTTTKRNKNRRLWGWCVRGELIFVPFRIMMACH